MRQSIIHIVAVVDEQLGLGRDNRLLCHLPADLQHFKTLTLGHPIIMGRKTFASIGKPLPGRQNVVLTREKLVIDGVSVANSLQHAFELTNDAADVMVIGGSGVFREALPFASYVHLTKIHHTFVADVFFPELSEREWACRTELYRSQDVQNVYDLTFYCYERIGA